MGRQAVAHQRHGARTVPARSRPAAGGRRRRRHGSTGRRADAKPKTPNSQRAGVRGPTGDEITTAHILEWRKGIATLVFENGDYKPGTTNGWLSTSKVILKEAKARCGLKHDVTDGVKHFNLAEHSTYSFEDPNS
jgi:hypothetical protein